MSSSVVHKEKNISFYAVVRLIVTLHVVKARTINFEVAFTAYELGPDTH